MEQSEKFLTSKNTVILLLILAVLGGAFYYFYYVRVNQMSTVSAFNVAYNSVRAAYADGDADTDATIAELQKLSGSAPNKEIQAKIEQSLIVSLFKRNIGDDRSTAIALAEKAVADTSATPRSRAITLTLLASLIRGEDDSFFRQYFSDAMLSKYLPPEGARADSLNTAIKMFKDAEAIYPTPYAEYNIAYTYAKLMQTERLADGSTSDEDMAREIQAYIKKGDKTFAADANYIPSTLAYFYYQRAWSLSYSGRILGNMTVKEREAGYTDAIAKISALQIDPYVIDALFETRYRYARLLLNNTKGRETDIQLILKDFGTLDPNLSDNKIVSGYFNSLKGTSMEAEKSIAELTKISPEFRGFLLKLGWDL